jgi:hypothetical protein
MNGGCIKGFILLLFLKTAKFLQSVARKVNLNMTIEESSLFSSQSGQVWAIILLYEAGMPP